MERPGSAAFRCGKRMWVGINDDEEEGVWRYTKTNKLLNDSSRYLIIFLFNPDTAGRVGGGARLLGIGFFFKSLNFRICLLEMSGNLSGIFLTPLKSDKYNQSIEPSCLQNLTEKHPFRTCRSSFFLAFSKGGILSLPFPQSAGYDP